MQQNKFLLFFFCESDFHDFSADISQGEKTPNPGPSEFYRADFPPQKNRNIPNPNVNVISVFLNVKRFLKLLSIYVFF